MVRASDASRATIVTALVSELERRELIDRVRDRHGQQPGADHEPEGALACAQRERGPDLRAGTAPTRERRQIPRSMWPSTAWTIAPGRRDRDTRSDVPSARFGIPSHPASSGTATTRRRSRGGRRRSRLRPRSTRGSGQPLRRACRARAVARRGRRDRLPGEEHRGQEAGGACCRRDRSATRRSPPRTGRVPSGAPRRGSTSPRRRYASRPRARSGRSPAAASPARRPPAPRGTPGAQGHHDPPAHTEDAREDARPQTDRDGDRDVGKSPEHLGRPGEHVALTSVRGPLHARSRGTSGSPPSRRPGRRRRRRCHASGRSGRSCGSGRPPRRTCTASRPGGPRSPREARSPLGPRGSRRPPSTRPPRSRPSRAPTRAVPSGSTRGQDDLDLVAVAPIDDAAGRDLASSVLGAFFFGIVGPSWHRCRVSGCGALVRPARLGGLDAVRWSERALGPSLPVEELGRLRVRSSRRRSWRRDARGGGGLRAVRRRLARIAFAFGRPASSIRADSRFRASGLRSLGPMQRTRRSRRTGWASDAWSAEAEVWTWTSTSCSVHGRARRERSPPEGGERSSCAWTASSRRPRRLPHGRRHRPVRHRRDDRAQGPGVRGVQRGRPGLHALWRRPLPRERLPSARA